MDFHNIKEKILIVDFGSQVTKLIARRVRDLGVYSEIITPEDLKKYENFNSTKGIILSGDLQQSQKLNTKLFQKNI